jgi:hypothetical protein
VPLLNIGHNANARHGLSTNRKLGIAFGSIIGGAFLAGLLTFLYLTSYYHRPWARGRARTWKQQLGPRNLRGRRGRSRRNTNDTTSLASTDGLTGPGSTSMPDVSTKSKAIRGRRNSGTRWSGVEWVEI